MPLLRHEDLTAPAKSNVSRTVAEIMIARMRDGGRPMPPSGQLPSAEINVIERWVAAGYPRGTCGSAAGADTGSAAPEVITAQCSSGRYWAEGDEKSPYMNPGLPCISCHAKENAERGRLRAPNLLGGTVYPTVREPNLCEGVPGGATIVITDAQQKQFSFPVNSAGNFYAFNYDAAGLTFPIRAKVVAGGKERAMATPQMTGDCNSCHTEQGLNGAPGRIFLPK